MEALTTSELLSRTYPKQDLIGGGILGYQSKLCIAAPPKVGKTFLAIQLAFEVAGGRPFLETFEVDKPLKVYYLQMEVAEKEFQKRIRRMGRLYSDTEFYSLSMKPIKLDTTRGQHFLAEELEECKADVLVIDPLARVHTRDENDMGEMGKLLAYFDRLIYDLRLSIVLIHHTRKIGFEERNLTRDSALKMQWMRGTSDLMGWVDGGVIMEKKKEDVRLLSFDLRNAPNPQPLKLIQDTDFLTWKTMGSLENIVKEILGKGSMSKTDLLKEIRGEGLSLEKARGIVGRALEAGVLEEIHGERNLREIRVKK